MKTNLRIVLAMSGVLLILAFNNCSVQERYSIHANLGLNNTSIAGNPMTPITSKAVTSVCQVITACHAVEWNQCESGMLATSGISSKLGLAAIDNKPFSDFQTAESQGQISGNSTALQNCSQSVEALKCDDARVKDSYKPEALNPFAGIPQLFSQDSGSCPNVATAVTPLKWNWANFGKAEGHNFSNTQNAYDPQMAVFNSRIYNTWIENNAGYNVRVSVNTDSGVTSFVDGSTPSGLNIMGSRVAETPYLKAALGKLYISWIETNGSAKLVRAKVYNGNDNAPAWIAVDNGGLNKNFSADASTVEMLEFGSQLYAIWTEKNGTIEQVRVAVYNGMDNAPAWNFVDGSLAEGLNFNKARKAFQPRMIEFNSALYATWSEIAADNGVRKIRVARFNGNNSAPSWVFVDGNTARGLNFSSGQNAQNPQLAVFNSKMYLTWQEWNSSSSEQIRVMSYNGSSWEWADGGQLNGLNWDVLGDAQVPQLLPMGSALLVTWREQVAGVGRIRVRSFNGNDALPVWSFIDGNSASGLNIAGDDANFSFKRNPMLQSLGSQLYLVWSEGNRIRMKSASQ